MFCITLTVPLNSKVEYGRTGHVFLRAVTLSSIREKKIKLLLCLQNSRFIYKHGTQNKKGQMLNEK